MQGAVHLLRFLSNSTRHLATFFLLSLTVIQTSRAEDSAALKKLDQQYLAALERIADTIDVSEERIWVEGGATGEPPAATGKLAVLRERYAQERAKLEPKKKDASEIAEMPAEWPTSVAVDLDFEVTVVKEDSENKVFLYRTPHFEFKSDSKLRASLVRGFSRIFEATYTAIHALPLPFQAVPPEDGFSTELFESESDYFLAGGPAGSAGVFISRRGFGKILIPLENLGVKKVGKGYSFDNKATNSTLKHELTHQICGAAGFRLPTWCSEGLAEFIAGAKYRNGRYNFNGIGGQLREHLKKRKGVWKSKHVAESVKRMMNISQREWNAGLTGGGSTNNYATAAMIVAYFNIWDEGDGIHIRNYLIDLKNGVEELAARNEHLLRGRSYEELEDDIAKGWRKEGLKLEFKVSS